MKRAAAFLLILVCLLMGSQALAEEKERETLTLGSKGELVVRVQQRLMDLGYYAYKPTGSFQAVTRRAVLAYERAANAREDGRLTPEEQDELFSGAAARAPFAATVPLSFTAQTTPFAVTGELWPWADVKNQLVREAPYTVTNCATGESCTLLFVGGDNHAHLLTDGQPATAQRLSAWLGESNSFYKIAVVVTIEGRSVAASLQYDNTVAHVYFQGSTSSVLNLPDAEHDSLILRAAGR